MRPSCPVLPGTLDLLALKAISLGAEHGYGILQRIQRASGGVLAIEQGALYPALYRLESQGLVSADWGISENNRRAKFYRLTEAGQRRLAGELAGWQRLVDAMQAVLAATPEQVRP